MFGAFSTITVRGLLYIHARRFITITRVYYSRIRYTTYVLLLSIYYIPYITQYVRHKSQTYTVAPTPSMTFSALLQKFRSFFKHVT